MWGEVGNTSLIDRYLCNGENVLYRIAKKGLKGTSEELAATNMRIIRAKGKNYYDIKYGHLSSIGNYTVFDRKRGFSAVSNLLLAVLFFAAAMAIPGVTSNFSDEFQAGLNSSFDQAVSQIYLNNDLNEQGRALQGTGLEGAQINIVAPPGGMGMVDLRNSFNALSTLMATLTGITGIIYLVTGLYHLLAFLLSVKKGIVMKTPNQDFTFVLGNRRRKEAQEFILTVRAAEEEKIKVMEQYMPEWVIMQRPMMPGKDMLRH